MDTKEFIMTSSTLNTSDDFLKHSSLSEEFLSHHGILGQKWGVRRTPAQLGHKPSDQKKESLKEKIQNIKATMAKKRADKKAQQRTEEKLADDELKARVARLRLEEEYRQLSSRKSQDTKSGGRKFIDGLLKSSIDMLKTSAGKSLTDYLDKAIFGDAKTNIDGVDPKGLSDKALDSVLSRAKKEKQLASLLSHGDSAGDWTSKIELGKTWISDGVDI